jgi:hypothetical protein
MRILMQGVPSPQDSDTDWVLSSLKMMWQTYGACSHRYTFLLLTSMLSSSFVVGICGNIGTMLPSALYYNRLLTGCREDVELWACRLPHRDKYVALAWASMFSSRTSAVIHVTDM